MAGGMHQKVTVLLKVSSKPFWRACRKATMKLSSLD